MLRILLVPILMISFTVNADVLYRSEESSETAEYLGLDSEGILVEFTLPALIAEEENVGDFGPGTVLRIPGEGMGVPVGSPDLPIIRRMVLIPSTGAVGLEIVSAESSPLGIFSIPPFQDYPIRSEGPAPYRINGDVYSNSDFYPSQSVVVERVSILRDIRIAWVRFSPVQHNPVTGETIISTNVSVRITVDGVGENELHRPFTGYTRSFLPIYRKVLGFEENESDVIDGSYLVIGSEESIAYAQDLIDWKRQTGLDVVCGLVPAIGGTSTEIDDWIENAYSTWSNPPEWILIVGDETVVPAYYSSGTEADNQYGVIGTGYDPSIHVGRICGNMETLLYQCWKIESYENDPYQPASSWFQHAISIGSYSTSTPNDPWMAWRFYEIFMTHGMPTTLYTQNGDYGGIIPTKAHITDEVNSGLSLLSYIGHGSHTAWGTTGFSNSDVAALSNGRRLPWISSIACYNCEFDYGYPCYGEAWMIEGSVSEPGGAIGFMGATKGSPIGPTDSLELYQYRGYFEEELYNMGAAFDYGKIMAFYYTGNSGNSDMHMIMGCPEFDIFTETSPLVYLDANHWENIQTGPFGVIVTAAGSPVKGAMVGIVQDTVLLQSGYTDGSGLVTLDIPAIPTSEDVTITCTFHNRYPYVGSAFVATGIEDGPDAVYDFSLAAPGPNPFAVSSVFSYTLASSGAASLDIYDVSGRIVRSLASGEHLSGTHSVTWAGDNANGSPVPGGIYLLRLTSGGETAVRSCVIVR